MIHGLTCSLVDITVTLTVVCQSVSAAVVILIVTSTDVEPSLPSSFLPSALP